MNLSTVLQEVVSQLQLATWMEQLLMSNLPDTHVRPQSLPPRSSGYERDFELPSSWYLHWSLN